MKDQVDFAARVICRVAAAVVLAAVAADAGMSQALAQQPAPKAQPKAQPKAEPKSAPATPPGQQPPGEPQLTYSPWTKVCQKGPEANAKRLCFIGKDGRIESGQPVVAAVVIEPEGEPRRSSPRHAAPRHVAAARHARDRRQWPAHDWALRDLLSHWLHGGLRGKQRADHQDEDGAEPARARRQWIGPAHQPRAAARRLCQGL